MICSLSPNFIINQLVSLMRFSYFYSAHEVKLFEQLVLIRICEKLQFSTSNFQKLRF